MRRLRGNEARMKKKKKQIIKKGNEARMKKKKKQIIK